ncbi:MAG: SH3 domain-containing protein [Propionicimonas sp.]
MYQPRRVADPIATAVPTPPAGVDPVDPGLAAFHRAPRRARRTMADRLLARGGLALAVVTASATAGAVALGSGFPSAEAVGASAVAVAPAAVAIADDASLAAAPAPASGMTADELAAPAAKKAKVAAKALVSVTPMYAAAAVNVRESASEKSDLLGTIALAARVSATATIDGKYRQVEYSDGYGWVLASQLTDEMPIEAAGTTWDPCPRGSAVENKLRKDTIHIYRSVCPLFPAVNSYGGWRAGGMQFHKNGRALDIMLTPHAETALGHRIANYLIAHAKVFNIDHIIFEQHIWTPSTPRWRKMADRGSITANHFDHVHVAIKA